MKFTELYPVDDLTMHVAVTAPTEKSENYSNALDMIVDHIATYIGTTYEDPANGEPKEDGDPLSEQMTNLVDQYFETPMGVRDYDTIKDIALKLGTKYHEARDILTKRVGYEVAKLSAQIRDLTTQKINAYCGYSFVVDGKHVAPLKFEMLDMVEVSKHLDATIPDLALQLCAKYQFSPEILTANNIHLLFSNIAKPINIPDVTPQTLSAVMGDVVVTVTGDGDGVQVDQDVPADDTTTQVNDKTTATEDPETSDTPADDKGIDDGEKNPIINVTVNGKKVPMPPEAEDLKDPEAVADLKAKKQLCELVVGACFLQSNFERLRVMLSDITPYRKNFRYLQHGLWISKLNLRELLTKATSKLSNATQEAVRTNLEYVEDLQRCAAVQLDLQMRALDKDALILGPRLLNKTMVDKAQANGMDVQKWIRDYLRLNHNSNTNDGIYDVTAHAPVVQCVTYDKLVATRPQVTQQLQEKQDALKTTLQKKYDECLAYAFQTVLNNYAQDIVDISPNSIPGTFTVSDFRRSVRERAAALANQLIGNPSSNVEDSIYAFYFTYWCQGTLVEKIYKDSAVALVTGIHRHGAEKLDIPFTQTTHAKVMSSIIIDELRKHF